MGQWRVHLQGEQFDLEELREILAGYDPSIMQDGSNFYLTSKEWDQVNDAGEIHSRAKELIQVLDNAAYIHFRVTAPLTIGGVIRIDDDGLKHYAIIPEPGVYTSRGSRVRMTVLGPDNQPVEVRKELIKTLGASTQYPVVQDALKFFRKGDWVSLYKAYELVRDDLHGEKEIIRRNWISKKTLSRFTGTAQSREALGDNARHASKKYKPPGKPMSLKEARHTIGGLLLKWIDPL